MASTLATTTQNRLDIVDGLNRRVSCIHRTMALSPSGIKAVSHALFGPVAGSSWRVAQSSSPVPASLAAL